MNAAHGDVGDGDGVLQTGDLVFRLDRGCLLDQALGADDVKSLGGERGMGMRLDQIDGNAFASGLFSNAVGDKAGPGARVLVG